MGFFPYLSWALFSPLAQSLPACWTWYCIERSIHYGAIASCLCTGKESRASHQEPGEVCSVEPREQTERS